MVGTDTYLYRCDCRTLMTRHDGPGTNNDSTYKYDALGRRITKDINGTKTAYFHDGLNVVAEYNGSNQLQRTYVTPWLDANLTLATSASTYYYLADGLGSVRQLLNAHEQVQNSYDYFAFGRTYGTPTENVSQPFRYTSRAYDVETSLYQYRTRYLRPDLARFATRDWLPRGAENVYAYVDNLPTYYIDPLGLAPTSRLCTCKDGKCQRCSPKTNKWTTSGCRRAKVWLILGDTRFMKWMNYDGAVINRFHEMKESLEDACCDVYIVAHPSAEMFKDIMRQADSWVFIGHTSGGSGKKGGTEALWLSVGVAVDVTAGNEPWRGEFFDYVEIQGCYSDSLSDRIDAIHFNGVWGRALPWVWNWMKRTAGTDESKFSCCQSAGSGAH